MKIVKLIYKPTNKVLGVFDKEVEAINYLYELRNNYDFTLADYDILVNGKSQIFR